MTLRPTHKEECSGLVKPQEPVAEPVEKLPVAKLRNEASRRLEPRLTQTSIGSPSTTKRHSAMDQMQVSGFLKLMPVGLEANSPQSARLSALRPKTSDARDDDDDVPSDEGAPTDPNLSKQKAKRRILYHLWKGKYERARQYAEAQYVKARMGLDKVDNDVEYAAGHLDEIMQDFLMYAKCLLLCEGSNLETIKEILHNLSENVMKCVKINYKEVKENMTEESANSPEMRKSFRDHDTYSVSGKSKGVTTRHKVDTRDFSDFKRILHMHAIIAAMYKCLENQAESEKAYARYCKIVEKLFGIQTVEASNCYYYIGIYYYEEELYEKALICMRKALFNRIRELGENDVTCADCHHNIGLIYKKLNQPEKAKAELEHALRIRQEGIGKSSLPCGNTLEELGKLALEMGDYKTARGYVQECYDIRKKVIKNPQHEDIARVSLLLIFLARQLDKDNRRLPEASYKRALQDPQLASLIARAQGPNTRSLTEPRGLLAESSTRSHFHAGSSAVTFASPNARLEPVPVPRGKERREHSSHLETIHEAEDSPGLFPHKSSKESLQLKDFAPKGPDQLFMWHTDNPPAETVLDVLVFLLSLDELQQELLNKTQMVWQASAPLSLGPDIKKLLSEYQTYLLGRTELSRLPRIHFLQRPEDVVEPSNLKLSAELRAHPTLSHPSLSEQTIGELMQSNSDFYKILNEVQVDILSTVTTLEWPLWVFIRSMKESQVQEFKEIVEEEGRGLERKERAREEYKRLPLVFKTEQRGPEEQLRTMPDKLSIQEDVLDFIERQLSPDMASQLVLDMTNEFYENLEHTQIVQISQLKTALKSFLTLPPDLSEEPKPKQGQWTSFVCSLADFVRTLNQKEAYQFAVCNRFMLSAPEVPSPVPVPVPVPPPPPSRPSATRQSGPWLQTAEERASNAKAPGTQVQRLPTQRHKQAQDRELHEDTKRLRSVARHPQKLAQDDSVPSLESSEAELMATPKTAEHQRPRQQSNPKPNPQAVLESVQVRDFGRAANDESDSYREAEDEEKDKREEDEEGRRRPTAMQKLAKQAEQNQQAQMILQNPTALAELKKLSAFPAVLVP